MSQVSRLDTGGRIDRSRTLEFTFNAKTYKGYLGDTLASALLANDVTEVGRSFKYFRTRGIIGAGTEEPNAIVRVESNGTSTPNLRATEVELEDGLIARSATTADRFGLRRLGSLVSWLMPVGFYYKTLIKPKSLWEFGEKLMREAAGLGNVPCVRDADTYDKYHHHCDLLVVGAGAAGLNAALAAAQLGVRVIIADEQTEFGGWLLSSSAAIDDDAATLWVERVVTMLEEHPNVVLLPRTTIFGLYDHNLAMGCERKTGPQSSNGGLPRERLHQIRANHVVLATGALERPLTFANNDIPGIMLPSAISTYLNRYSVAPGDDLVLSTTNDQAYEAAFSWCDRGKRVVAICDSRTEIQSQLIRCCEERDIQIFREHVVIEAHKGKRLDRVQVARLSSDKRSLIGKPHHISCDLLATSSGWNPLIHLNAHTRTMARWDEDEVAFVLHSKSSHVATAGAINGVRTLSACMNEGVAAIRQLRSLSKHDLDLPVPRIQEIETSRADKIFRAPHFRSDSRAPKQFVDYQLDVTAADIQLAAREGYSAIEHVKRYTALGFGNDQGKLSNVNGIAILSDCLDKSMGEIGTTVFRPPYTPVTFGAIAGRSVGALFDPERQTPMHQWHVEHDAMWENVGQWKRPWYYPQSSESMGEAVNREVFAARNSVAVLDASTLGKIDVQGNDAAVFVDRMYCNAFIKLSVGRCRYGLMLRDTGMIFDDGVTARLAEDHFLIHTTTGNAEAVLSWLELWHQTEWPDLDVRLTSVTDHWATAAIVGPKSRHVVHSLFPELDLSNESFPSMSVQSAELGGIEARIFRISFSGELSYEINIPAQYGLSLWEQIFELGKPYGIAPYGTETMHVLRAEKGFIIAGQDTDGSMTPADMNMAWCVRKNNNVDFVGRRSLAFKDHQRRDRLQFVGLETREPLEVLPEGGQLLDKPTKNLPAAMQGFVTSSYFSATLGRSIALAMIKGGHHRYGETLHCALHDGRFVQVDIVSGSFYDPDNSAQKAEVAFDVFSSKVRASRLSRTESVFIRTTNEADRSNVGISLHVLENVRLATLLGPFNRDQHESVLSGSEANLPLEPCTWLIVDGVKVCWLSPNRWLMLVRLDDDGSSTSGFSSSLPSSINFVDSTGNYTVYSLTGPRVKRLLQKSCAYDFDESVFSTNSCVQTTFAKTQALIVGSESDQIELIVRRSYADYVYRWIEDASREFGFMYTRESHVIS